MTADQLSTTFAALADPTRRAVWAGVDAGRGDRARARRAVAALQAGGGAAEGRRGLGGGIPAVLGGEFRSVRRLLTGVKRKGEKTWPQQAAWQKVRTVNWCSRGCSMRPANLCGRRGRSLNTCRNGGGPAVSPLRFTR